VSKRAANIENHGIEFVDVATVFDGAMLVDSGATPIKRIS
jgi:uncharacterized DUF497 family protein